MSIHTQTLTCPVCKQDQLCQSIPAKPFSRVISKACKCGYHVQVVATLDVEKLASSCPLPGYSREEMHQKYDNFRFVVGQDSGFVGS
jgi:C4-type Zn-finger protein